MGMVENDEGGMTNAEISLEQVDSNGRMAN
jgi:hypothetical protein